MSIPPNYSIITMLINHSKIHNYLLTQVFVIRNWILIIFFEIKWYWKWYWWFPIIWLCIGEEYHPILHVVQILCELRNYLQRSLLCEWIFKSEPKSMGSLVQRGRSTNLLSCVTCFCIFHQNFRLVIFKFQVEI